MKRIAILVETALASGRQIVSGIARYARERHDWSIFFHTGPLGALVPSALENWSGDGIIARIADEELLDRVKSRRTPIVDVLGNLSDPSLNLVTTDAAGIARMVANHFRESGHRKFAYLGLGRENWSLERRHAFREEAQRKTNGAGPDPSFQFIEFSHQERKGSAWSAYLDRLSAWLQSLPKPVGIMVGSDQFAPDLLEACRRLRLSVPDQVSIVGVDNDLPFCDICQPRLSSVEPNHESVGYEAAKRLDALIERPSLPRSVIEVPPLALFARESSDATALDDPQLVKALRFIRERGCQEIGVDDIAAAAGLSRSVLQRRFKASLRKTVLETIQGVRLNRAKEMLSLTDLPLADVADRCGFKHQEYLGYVFKKKLQLTPGQYRSQTRPSESERSLLPPVSG